MILNKALIALALGRTKMTSANPMTAPDSRVTDGHNDDAWIERLHRQLPVWETRNAIPLYLSPPAAVPVEALEGLVAEMDEFLDAEYEPNLDTIQKWSNELAQLIERSKELIKERSNG